MKTLTTIFILLTTLVNAQSLMLSCTKLQVKTEMANYPEWNLTVSAANYLEYQKDSTAIAYSFTRTGKLTPWVCDQASIAIAPGAETEFISTKAGCNCWKPTGPDEWLYQTNVFDRLVTVTRYHQPGSVTFVYRFR